MYVSPGWQRHGVGNMLLQWGLERAADEYVPIVCKSTSVGVYFYEHAGFRSLERQMLDLYFDPGHRCYHSMIWYPREWEKTADITLLQSEHDEMADFREA
jgi:GNAT superfamily N-acetyltransferase